MLLIGSRALMWRAPGLLKRKPIDFDWICTQDEFDNWIKTESHLVKPTKVYSLPEFNKMIVEGSTNCEFEIVTPGASSEILYDLVKKDSRSIETEFGTIPNLDILFTIKDSHKYKKFNNSPIGFWKTAIDWHKMKQVGATIRDEYKIFHKLREKESYTNVLPKLNVSKQNFFDSEKNGVKQIFIHDDIHKAVAIHDRPAYEYYLAEGSEVLTSKKKFFECSEPIRLAGVLEEALTLSIERSLAPFPKAWEPDYAFRFALAKVASSITGGYFREYSFQNIFKVIKMYSEQCSNFYEKFEEKVKNGTVRYNLGET